MKQKYLKLETELNSTQDNNENQITVESAYTTMRSPQSNIFKETSINSDRINNMQGPKFTKNGEIVNYSIVGKVEWFLNQRSLSPTKRIQNEFIENQEINQQQKLIDTSQQCKKRKKPFIKIRSITQQQQQNEKDKLQISELQENNEHILNQEEINQEIDYVKKRIQENQSRNQDYNQRLLNKIQYGERNILTKDQRILDRFDSTQQNWKFAIQNASRQLNRSPEHSIIMKSQNHRAKQEAIRIFDILEPDERKYGQFHWIMQLRNYEKRDASNDLYQPIKKRASIKVINDLPAGFNTTMSPSHSPQLEIIRAPFDSKMKSKYEGMHPYTSHTSGFYFRQKLANFNEKQFELIRHMDDRETDQLQILGENKFQKEANSILDITQKQIKTYQKDNDQQINLNGEEIITAKYNKQQLCKRGELLYKKYQLKL